MATSGEIKFDPIVTTQKVANPVEVHREFDMIRQEERIAVSCTRGNRTYRRQASWYADEFTDIEVRILADTLRQFIQADIQG